MRKNSLSVIVITKNEEPNIHDCLASIHDIADEIIVFDSGSSDKTQDIAETFKARFIVDNEWKGYGVQRQKAQQFALSNWILWLDADERATPKLCEEIKEAINIRNDKTIYFIPRLSWVFGRFIKHSGWYPDYVIRLHPNKLTQYNTSTVHEKLIIPDDIQKIKLTGNILHYTYRDLRHYLEKSAYYASLWSEQRVINQKKSSLSQGVLHAFGCFIRMYIIKLGFLDGRHGFLLAVLSAHSTFVKYADLWIKTQTNDTTP